MLSAVSVLSLALLAQPALAEAPQLDATQLQRRDALLDRVAEHFGASDSGPAPAQLEHGPSCLMGLVVELQQDRDLFSDQEWAWVREHVVLLDDTLAPPPSETPVEEDEAKVSCLGRVGANAISSEHFVVEWDSSSVTETMATNTLDALESSWTVFIDDYDWPTPAGTDDYPILFYIDNSNYQGAYTTIASCSGEGYVPYIVAGRGSYSAGDWYKTMAGHEFHHAIQWGISYAHEFYWWEATATWSEEYAFPDINDWASAYMYFPAYPNIAFNSSNQDDPDIFWHMYSMGIFGTFLDEYFGGHATVRATWEASASRGGQYNYRMPDVIEDIGLVWEEVYPQFMATTAWMDFSEYRYYYTPQDLEGWGYDVLEEVDSLPASGDEMRDAPQSLGLNHFFFDADLGAEGQYLQVDFSGDSDADSWTVVLTTGDDHDLVSYAVAELDDDLQGSVTIPFDGSDDAYLIVSPYQSSAVGLNYDWIDAEEFDFEWDACLVDAEGGEPCFTDAGTEGETDDPATPDDESGKASSCSTVGASPAVGIVWALGLFGLVATRRRR